MRKAHFVLSNEKNRKIFDALTNNLNSKNDSYLQLVKQKVEKKMPSILKTEDLQDQVEILTDIAFEYAKKIARESSPELNFKELFSIYSENISEKDTEDDWEENTEESLQVLLNSLIEQEILFLGVKNRCNVCGKSSWYGINDLKQNYLCIGCNARMAIQSETPWRYKLNSLINSGLSNHGLLPVILSLGLPFDNLMELESFFYNSSTVILDKDDKKVGEIDFIFIFSGHLYIGESKNSFKNLKADEIRKTLECAKIIGADQVIFSAMDDWTKKKFEEMKSIAQKLDLEEIKVRFINLSKPITSTLLHGIPIQYS